LQLYASRCFKNGKNTVVLDIHPWLWLAKVPKTGGDMKTFDAVLEDEDPPQAWKQPI